MTESLANQLVKLPTTSGVYKFCNSNAELIYIGKAIQIKKRVKSYFQKNLLSSKTKQFVSQIDRIETIKTDNEFDALLLEARLIKKFQPKYNTVWRDDKHPLYIKITSETYPKILTSRHENESKSVYFGPFPSSAIVKSTLRFIRQIFPYCSEKRVGKKPCFFSHISLCNPCPNYIESLSVKDKILKKKDYTDNISMIKKLLKGHGANIISNLEKEMYRYARMEQFEKADQIKNQLQKLEYLRKNRTPIKEYMENPNLYDDIRQQELYELSKRLQLKNIIHIEGYDISNTQGVFATGSLVTFIKAEPNKSLYRKFRIRFKNTPNDTMMMYEVLSRRLNHTEWSFPDLIIVDGGRGQVNAALTAMREKSVSIPIIGLAKKLEEVIFPLENGSFKVLRLSNSSGALHLLQRIRDEAHRFANAYHRSLRSKGMIYQSLLILQLFYQ